MKDQEHIIIEDTIYLYESFYQRLELVSNSKPCKNQIRCPKCHNDRFTISYGTYECIANCSCGHSMVIYDG